MNVKNKLESLRRTVNDETREEAEKLIADMEAEFERKLNDYRKQLELEAESMFSLKKEEADRIRNKSVTLASKEAKHSLIDLRSQLIEELFAAVTEKLVDYIETDDYQRELIEGIRNTVRKFGNSTIIKLCERDLELVKTVLRDEGITLAQAETDILGGYLALIHESGIQIDCSYSSALIREREDFHAFKIQ